MQTEVNTIELKDAVSVTSKKTAINFKPHIKVGLKARSIRVRNLISFLKTSYGYYGSIIRTLKTLMTVRNMQKQVWGHLPQKWAFAGNRYHFMMYTPGFPSSQLRKMHLMEIKRLNKENKTHELRFAFFAITKKCPLSCLHCFEWDKLNAKELMSYDELRKTVLKLKDMGIVQLHLSGGEPMLRVKDIAKLAAEFSNEIEFYVLTSGFNATASNLALLKQSGVTGICVSLDHYERDKHNIFRGSENSYDDAINAIKYARALDMIVTVSICVNREMATFEQMLQYANLAKSLDASFIQLLEPRQVGNYAGKDVLLNDAQIEVLNKFFEKLNYDKNFKEFPIVVFHRYYQSKVGCFSAGNRALYIDTNGDIMLCPFCHKKSGNVLSDNIPSVIPMMLETGCPTYGSTNL